MRETIAQSRGLSVKEKNVILKLIKEGKSKAYIINYIKNNFLVDLEAIL